MYVLYNMGIKKKRKEGIVTLYGGLVRISKIKRIDKNWNLDYMNLFLSSRRAANEMYIGNNKIDKIIY